MDESAERFCVLVLFLTSTVLLVSSCKNRVMTGRKNLEEFETLIIYDVDGFASKKTDNDALLRIPHKVLEKNVVQEIFRDVKYHKGSLLLWKGSSLGIATTQDARERRIAMSHYGGFFKILNEKGYYEIIGESRRRFDKEMKRILVDVFIPARRKALDVRSRPIDHKN